MISVLSNMFNSEDPLIQKYKELLRSRRFSLHEIKGIINRFLSGNNRKCSQCDRYTEARECHGRMTEINIDCGPLLIVSAEEGHKDSIEYILSKVKKRNLSCEQFIEAAKHAIKKHDLSIVSFFTWSNFSTLCMDNFGILTLSEAIAESYVDYVTQLFTTIVEDLPSTSVLGVDEFFQSSNIGTLVPTILPKYMEPGWSEIIKYVDQANFYRVLGLSNQEKMWAAKDKLLNHVRCLWVPEHCDAHNVESYRTAAEILIEELDVTSRHRLWLRKVYKKSIMCRIIRDLIQSKKMSIIINERKSVSEKQYDMKRLQSLFSDDNTCFMPSAVYSRKDWLAVRSNQVPWRYFFNRQGRFRPSFKCCVPIASFCLRNNQANDQGEDQELMDESIWSTGSSYDRFNRSF